MIVDSSGVTKSTLTEYLEFWTSKLREVFGNSYVIKKEGVVDNLATASSLTNLALEDVILYLIKNMNPYTAEGEFQDALYSLVNLVRTFSSFTTVTRTIEGNPNTVCNAGSIKFKNKATDDIFELNSSVTLDENGKGIGSFTAIELGAIELPQEALLEIIDAPTGIVGVYYSQGNSTIVGEDYEDNSEFRQRWISTNSIQRVNNTGEGLKIALLPIVGNNIKNIKIRQNRGREIYEDLPLHTMNIIVKSAESDETIANAIFENLTDGVGLAGTTTKIVKDSENQDVEIKFTKAEPLAIYFNIEVVLKNGTTISQISDSIKKAITDNFNYEVGERIIANDFYQYINNLEGIDYVTVLEISTDGETYTQTIPLEYYQYGEVSISDITVDEA